MGLKELRNWSHKLFLCLPQKQAETQPTFETATFQIKFTLLHIRLNIWIWKTKFTSYKQYFFFLVFPSWEMERRPIQTKVYNKLFYPVSKEASQTFKSRAAKKYFPSVFIIDATCFDECFLFYVITGHSIFYTNLLYPRGLVQPPCCCILWNKCFARSPDFVFVILTIILW